MKGETDFGRVLVDRGGKVVEIGKTIERLIQASKAYLKYERLQKRFLNDVLQRLRKRLFLEFVHDTKPSHGLTKKVLKGHML